MSTLVRVNAYVYSVTYVTDNILRSIQDIVRMSGLDPSKIAGDWQLLESGLRTWLDSKDLKTVVLEVYDPTKAATDEPIGRWDIEIAYEWTGDDGRFWVDTEQIKTAIKKAGVLPAESQYRIVCTTKEGRQDVPGWSSTTLRPTAGMIKQSLGTTVEHCGLGAATSYYRKRP
jgi:hypothetical protein